MKTRRWFINLALNECYFHIKSRMLAIDFFMFSEWWLETPKSFWDYRWFYIPQELDKRILSVKLKIAVMDFSLPSWMNDFFRFFCECKRRVGEIKILEIESLGIRVILSLKNGEGPTDFFGSCRRFWNKKLSLTKKGVGINEHVTLNATVSVSGINFGV
jgi:hypothetical protein